MLLWTQNIELGKYEEFSTSCCMYEQVYEQDGDAYKIKSAKGFIRMDFEYFFVLKDSLLLLNSAFTLAIFSN